MSDIPFNMKAERISSICNNCKGDGFFRVGQDWKGRATHSDCYKCNGHGKLVVATRYVCDVKEPFPKAKD